VGLAGWFCRDRSWRRGWIRGPGVAAALRARGRKPGKTLRSVIEVSNRSTTPAHYFIHTADWSLSQDFSVTFRMTCSPDSCRPWVAIERPEVVVPGGGTLRYRFEVTVPADARRPASAASP
jgi:hypothetical protein